MRGSLLVMGLTAGFLLACGGGGAGAVSGGDAASAEPKYGSVAYQKYEAGTDRIKFKTESTVQNTWRNMSGSAVSGTYTHEGDLLHIIWDPAADNTNRAESKYRQLSECSFAEFWWKGKDGKVREDDSVMWQRTEPKCPK